MRVGSAGEYESFEHVQKLRVASTNEFHSCLCMLRTCSYRVCLTAYMLYSRHSHCIRTVFWLFLLYTRSFVHVGGTGADTNGPEHYEWRWNVPETAAMYLFVLIFVLIRLCLTSGMLIRTYIRTIFLLNSVHSCSFM